MKRWSELPVIGIKDVDDQHAELLVMFNQVQDAVERQKDDENFSDIFMFLEDYAHSHFNTEYALMKKYEYPDYEFHKAQHDRFIEELAMRKRDFLMQGQKARTDVVVWLHFWLRKHILSVDKVMGDFVLKKRGGGPEQF